MEIKETQNKKTEVITDIICDCCGKSCKVDNGDQHSNFEFMKLESHWGFHSGKDTQKWTAQICEKCVDEKLSFINFKKELYM